MATPAQVRIRLERMIEHWINTIDKKPAELDPTTLNAQQLGPETTTRKKFLAKLTTAYDGYVDAFQKLRSFADAEITPEEERNDAQITIDFSDIRAELQTDIDAIDARLKVLDEQAVRQQRLAMEQAEHQQRLDHQRRQLLDEEEQRRILMERERTLVQERQDAILRKELEMKELESITRQELERQYFLTNGNRPNDNSIQTNGNSQGTIRLPKQELPKFNGDQLQWKSFLDAFETAVDKNQSLQPHQKLSYLMSTITGPAKQSIAGYALTNENYQPAIETLKKRYGNTNELVNAHYNAMQQLPAARTIGYVRTVFDQFQTHLRSLNALGEDTRSGQSVALLLNKLPREFKLDIDKAQTDQWTMETLTQTIERFLKIHKRNEINVDRGQSRYNNDSRKSMPQSTTTYPKRYHATAEALVASNRVDSRNMNPVSPQHGRGQRQQRHQQPQQQRPLPNCAFCNELHYSDDCRTYPTIAERKERLKMDNKCFKCLKIGHRVNDCNNRYSCQYCHKDGQHHKSICLSRSTVNNARINNDALAHERNQTIPDNHALVAGTNEPYVTEQLTTVAVGQLVFMQMATATISNDKENQSKLVRILMDVGSTRTYITKTIAQELKLKPVDKERWAINTFGHRNPKPIDVPIVNFQLCLRNGRTMTITAGVLDEITGTMTRNAEQYDKIKNLVRGLDLADDIPKANERMTVDVLIGCDFWSEIVSGKRIKLADKLYAWDSKLGYLLTGSMNGITKRGGRYPEFGMLTITEPFQGGRMPFIEDDERCPIQYELKDLWQLETLGTKQEIERDADEAALDNFNNTLRKVNQRYEVKWPWKDDEISPPDNYGLANGRLQSVWKRLNETNTVDKYDSIIQDQLERGIIEEVRNEANNPRVHYLAHHPVITPDKETTKVRIVYDGSAKKRKGELSLNECLYRGPVLLEDICHLLVRFRTNEVAMVADIEKAFLQVGLQEHERDVTRFLWLKNPKQPPDPDNIRTYRFTRVPFGVISSPFLLAATIRHHLNETGGPVATKIANDIYVDNVITGCNNDSDAQTLYHEAKLIFNDASMNLREWVTNSKPVTNVIDEKHKAKSTTIKILGIRWNATDDTLHINIAKENDQSTTKRQVLSYVHGTFDPLGLLCPIMVSIKNFLQTLWQEDMQWDETLDNERSQQFRQLQRELQNANMPIPRWIGTKNEDGTRYQLHAFCDASNKAYATAIYLRWQKDDQVQASLIFAKSRMIPKAQTTIPRLELLAIHMGTKVIQFIQRAFQYEFESIYVWTDSQCCLHWMRSVKPLSVFVENRIKEMRSKEIEFRYVPTNDNPADIASRGTTIDILKNATIWWNGPPWLTKSIDAWPTTILTLNDQIRIQLDEESRKTTTIFTMTTTSRLEEPPAIPLAKFSSLLKLLRVTAWCKRFITNCRNKAGTKTKGEFEAHEIEDARIFWVKNEQRRLFDHEIRTITRDQFAQFGNLTLFMDRDGILRCKGRLENAQIPYDSRNPAILPCHSHFTKLIIEDTHRNILHAGTSHTLSRIRQRYWITKGRSTVYHILQACYNCKRSNGGPYQLPEMPDLPTERVNPAPPFAYVGIDYMGPLYVKENDTEEKRWICIFTCTTTRAIHLEVINNLSAQSFNDAFRIFINLRKKPIKVWSDNARYFISHETKRFAAQHGIEWNYITRYAPWKGGFYERLIQTVKRAIIHTLGSKLLTNNQLRVFITEIISAINSRPLLYIGEDLNGQTLSPNDFLQPTIDTPYNGINPDAPQLQTIFFAIKQRLHEFWSIWKHDYLTSLREFHRRYINQRRIKSKQSPEEGEVVLVQTPATRQHWAIGTILKLLKSKDGCVRNVRIQLSNGKTTTRSIGHVYPLEVKSSRWECRERDGKLETHEDTTRDDIEIDDSAR